MVTVSTAVRISLLKMERKLVQVKVKSSEVPTWSVSLQLNIV